MIFLLEGAACLAPIGVSLLLADACIDLALIVWGRLT